MNVLKIKGSHTAIKSGIEAGNAIFKNLVDPPERERSNIVQEYQTNMENSWVWDELHSARNIKNSFKTIYSGLFYGGIYHFLRGKEPIDLRNKVKDSDKLE